MEEALKYFEFRYQYSKELYEANPRSESLKNGLAISYSRLGSIHQSMGHMEEALKYFENYNRFEKELYEANPQSEEIKEGLAISYQFLGIIHKSMGNMEEALKYFELYNKLGKELYEANPRSEEMKMNVANSIGWTGDLLIKMGKMDEGLKNIDKATQLFKDLYEANPRSESLKNGLAISYSKLGDIHQSMSHMEEALKNFENYNQLKKELYEANPRNVNLLEGLGISYYKLAMLYKSTGNDTIGKERFVECKKIISFLAANLPQVPKYREMNKVEFDSLTQNEDYSYHTQTDTNNENSYPIQKDTNKDDVLTDEQKLINNLIQNIKYGEALKLLKKQEESLRLKNYNPVEFQKNTGEQAFVVSKLGRFKEALQMYEIQSEICAINKINDKYVVSLISQAEILIKHLNKPKQAKDLLLEAIAVAEENKLNQMVHEAEKMLKEIK
jgi:tetratricopeptide (TPR) repeat protein